MEASGFTLASTLNNFVECKYIFLYIERDFTLITQEYTTIQQRKTAIINGKGSNYIYYDEG